MKTLKRRYDRMLDVTGPAGTLLLGCVGACMAAAAVGLFGG